MPRNSLTFEVCIDTAAGYAACADVVDRIELCSALDVGGLTPCPGLIAAAQDSAVPSHVMIRPRAGDFCYDATDQKAMRASIEAVKKAGLAGVVIGASKGDQLDIVTLRELVAAAEGLEVTLHRVIDLLPEPLSAMEQAIDLGIHRILTSGGAPRAEDGQATLQAMQAAAKGRIEIMVGSGVSVSNLAELATNTGITSFHASCGTAIPVAEHLHHFGFAKTQKVTDRDTVLAFRKTLDTLSA
ncbi:copper homeostasis protein CutC [Shimia sagamensis]|uniref:PF03932 family protein CutC n=1 Tax=Shimia sagamensis TaxID=1566352 RepID=A0ABY1ND15_9RHOB|nr:copper homeostasis protein CutC [Shimia sagamensis]SMP06784.1 copper homeostasis protein [Shimia sagamensis]